MPKEEMDEYHWPHTKVLVGCLVSNFNPSSSCMQQEEHKVSKDDITMLIFEITWDHFSKMYRAWAIHDINEVIEAGCAEYTPGNKDGIIIDHSYDHVVAYFNMDDTYYIQHGHVTNVWVRPRGETESLVEKYGKALVRV